MATELSVGVAELENVGRATFNVQRSTVRHLYVHIPFCARICPYCAFYKERADPAQTARFCEALLRELDLLAEKFDLAAETIFFGGGTPTALSTAQLEMLLGGFHERLNLSHLQEWTIEANPGSVSPRKAALLRQAGVTRISLGVQSWDDDLLGLLGREHNAAQAEESFRVLREAGCANVNIDLMFGLPGQTLAQWQATLARTIALAPEHISTYCLTYEEDTEFFLRHARGEYRQDHSSDARFFEAAMEMLEAAGYSQYEISNYARPGHESIHNRSYWAGEDYLGLGPSAFSTIGFERWQNVCDYRSYSDRVLGGDSPVASEERLTRQMKRTEQIALGLRTREGVPVEWLASWPNESNEFLQLGLLTRRTGRLALTKQGKLLADSVAEAFIS
ncbi:MAG TPA: radical SAM family heme chaperone HemW [Chthoniobacterales bacterium]|nr:radical SAM family heme chaperone HemW [Chthoniobacterales bacterium]